MAEFARPFRVTFPDGIPEDEVLHGVQFPSGRCVVDNTARGLYDAATSFEHLHLSPDAEVEWADGGEA